MRKEGRRLSERSIAWSRAECDGGGGTEIGRREMKEEAERMAAVIVIDREGEKIEPYKGGRRERRRRRRLGGGRERC